MKFPYFIKELKWKWQRANRGWADCDWWNFNDYLIDIILPMLRELKANGCGYPGCKEADTPEKWDAILDEMITGFEAGKRLVSGLYPLDDYTKLYKADEKIFNKSMKLFTKWFLSLWD